MYSTKNPEGENPGGEGQEGDRPENDMWKRLRRPYEDYDGRDTTSVTLLGFRMPDGKLKTLNAIIPDYEVLAGRLDEVVGPGGWSLLVDRCRKGSSDLETICTLRIGQAERPGLASLPNRCDAVHYGFFEAARRFGFAPKDAPTYRIDTPGRLDSPSVMIGE